MGTVETVLLILNVIRSEIETMIENTASADFVDAYTDCLRIVDDVRDGFIDGIAGR